jgi:hypothetical protein
MAPARGPPGSCTAPEGARAGVDRTWSNNSLSAVMQVDTPVRSLATLGGGPNAAGANGPLRRRVPAAGPGSAIAAVVRRLVHVSVSQTESTIPTLERGGGKEAEGRDR